MTLNIPKKPEMVTISFSVRDIDYTKINDGDEPICQWCQDQDAHLEYWITVPSQEGGQPRKILEICEECHVLMENPQ